MITSEEFEVQVSGMHAVYINNKHAEPFRKKGFERIRVEARHEGKSVSFHAALQQRDGMYVITFSKAKQKELGVYTNDVFYMKLFEDTTRFGVEIPEELEAVLNSDPEAMQIFETLTDGRKRSLIYAIRRYKNSQTRIDKSLLLCENLKMGLRDPAALLKSS